MLSENQVIKLRDSLNNEGYCQVNNIFHSQLIDYLKIGFKLIEPDLFEESNRKKTPVETYGQNSLVQYSPILSETLLASLTSIISKISGKNLVPSYSYFRKYYQTNSLIKHTDRPSCQYSATIQVNSSSDQSWPIWIKSKTGKDIECKSKLGDIVFYKGEEVEHWREPLQYEYSCNVFLHWIDFDNPNYKKYKFDRRKKLGDPLPPPE